ncbi:MAG TPA: oligosaccharide flippase family protein [Silvibacterium sp.]|jgi:O-antigen/teichoic acid export membrane protein|nr:oligosaccharide flippase family protein [Silvibacterium sp.]
MKRYLQRLQGSAIAKNTLWMLGGNGLKLVIQAAYFVLIARSLEPAQYGAFVAVVAFAAIVSPFVGLGTSNLIIRNVARDKDSFSWSWGNGLLVTLVSGAAALILVLSSTFLLPANLHWSVLFFVAAADLIFGRIVDFCGFVFSAVNRFGATAQLNIWSSLSRLIGLSILVAFVRRPSIEYWAAIYLVTTFATAAGALGWGLMALEKPTLKTSAIWPELKEGVFFSVGLSAQTVYNDIDKTMLAKLGDLSATGIYGAAYRIIDVSLVPLRSILSAANPGFFRAGHHGGIRETRRLMGRLLPKTIAYAVLASIALLVFAPVVPHILGKEYERSVSALRWLAILPVLKTIHSFFADALTGAGYQRLRTIIQIAVAVFNILINLWIIPAYSWLGAAWSSIASDAALLCLLAVAITTLSRRQPDVKAIMEEAVQ